MKTLEESVTAAMDGQNIEIFPFLPYILQDFWEMGSSPETVIQLIRKHFENYSALHVLDLGCGKGAVSIKLAKSLNCHSLGIFEHPTMLKRSELIRQTEEAGMELIDEIIAEYSAMIVEKYAKDFEHIKKRCTELIKKYPEKTTLFKSYIQSQDEEYDVL